MTQAHVLSPLVPAIREDTNLDFGHSPFRAIPSWPFSTADVSDTRLADELQHALETTGYSTLRHIGVDLGTSNSAAAVLRGGRPVVIPGSEGISLGGKAFPSYVAITADGQILVGEPARRQATSNPEGTATAFKRKMGQRVSIKLRGREFTPEQLSGFLLQKIKRDAEAFLGEPVDKAVITVPAYFDDVFRGFDMGFGFGGSIFDRFFGRRHKGPPRGADIEFRIDVPLERIASGGEEKVSFKRLVECSICHGTKAAPGSSPKDCPTCQGTGQQVQKSQKKGVFLQQITTCPACHGEGKLIEKPCPQCHGVGRTESEESLTIKIPVGAEEGLALRVPGRGEPAPVAGGQPGDLLVYVYNSPDPRFERRGMHLSHVAQITPPDAVLGTTLAVPTLDGPTQVKVPTSTQP